MLFSRSIEQFNNYNYPEKMMIDDAIHQFEIDFGLDRTANGELQLLEERLKKYLHIINTRE
jgi:hypothetical protein